MRSRAWLTVVLAAPVVGVALASVVSACGGAVEADDFTAGQGSSGGRPGRRPGGGGRDPSGNGGAINPVVDAAAAACACTDELEQVDGSCSFRIGASLIACVADHTADDRDAAAAYAPLEGVTSCRADAGPSWSPSASPDELTLCGCTPGQARSLCVRYY